MVSQVVSNLFASTKNCRSIDDSPIEQQHYCFTFYSYSYLLNFANKSANSLSRLIWYTYFIKWRLLSNAYRLSYSGIGLWIRQSSSKSPSSSHATPLLNLTFSLPAHRKTATSQFLFQPSFNLRNLKLLPVQQSFWWNFYTFPPIIFSLISWSCSIEIFTASACNTSDPEINAIRIASSAGIGLLYFLKWNPDPLAVTPLPLRTRFALLRCESCNAHCQ